MTDAAHLLELHSFDESFEVARCDVPPVNVLARTFAVAVPSLVVAVHMPNRGQRLRNRPVDRAEESGRMQQQDRCSVAAPIEIMQPDAVDDHVATFRFVRSWIDRHDAPNLRRATRSRKPPALCK